MNIPTYNISLAKVESCYDELLPLIKSHFNEISYHSYSGFELNPNKQMYIDCEKHGNLKLFIVKSGGNIIGYSAYFLNRHPHVNILQAYQDAIYLSPDYRKFGIGTALIQFADNLFKQLGVSVVFNAISDRLDFSKSLMPLGYKLVDKLYARRL